MSSIAAQYAAFISYSREDRGVAATLQGSLESFAKARNVSRGRRIFRDESSLAAGSSLPDRLRSAIESSEYLILLASPEAAQSKWVQKEVEIFLARQPIERLLIVLVRGHITWDGAQGDFQRDRQGAIPPSLHFPEEPLYVDLSWWGTEQDKVSRKNKLEHVVANLTAAMTGQPKDELLGTHLREYDKERRRLRFNLSFRGAIGGGLSVTLVIAAIYSTNLSWLLLPLGTVFAGSVVALSIGAGLRGIVGFGSSFLFLGLGFLFAGVRPFRDGAGDLGFLFWFQVLSFYLTGVIGAWISKAVPVGRSAASLTSVGASLSITVLLLPIDQRPFPLEFSVFAAPWLLDRLEMAAEIIFGRGRTSATI